MRTLLIAVVAVAAGFVLGLMLSELIGVVGIVVFNQPLGIKYLPVILAVLAPIAALLIDYGYRRRAR